MFSDNINIQKNRSAGSRFYSGVVRASLLVCRPVLLVLFLGIFSKVFSQKGTLSEKSLGAGYDYSVKSWNSESGLPQNTIMACIQTHDGYLWMSTTNGLVKFDGDSFRVYTNQNTPALTDNCIVTLVEDSRNDLWMITSSNKLIKYSHGIFEKQEFPSQSVVTSIAENDKKEMLLGLENGSICTIKGKSITMLCKTDQAVRSMVFIPGRGIYFSVKQGTFLFDGSKLTLIKGLEETRNICLKKGMDETIWAYNNYFIWEINGTEAKKRDQTPDIMKAGLITDILVQQKNKLWVSTTNGIFILEGAQTQCINTQCGLPTNSITTLINDRDNNVWVGTNNAGLCRLKQKTIRTYSQEEGLMDDGCGPLLNYKDSSFLASNLCKEVSLFEDGRFSLFNKKHIGCIWSMVCGKDNELYMGTYGSGLYILKNGKINKCFEGKELPIVFFALFRDNMNNIWAGTKNGLFVIRNGNMQAVKPDQITAAVVYIMQDSRLRIWFCSDEGLGVIEEGNLKFFTKKDGLPHERVRHIYEDKDGVFWIATYGGGIARFKNEKFFSYGAANSLMDKTTSCIIEDKHENLWISSNHGVYSVRKSNLNDFADNKAIFLHTRYYGREDGMKNTECNGGFQGAGIKMKSGKILFPTLGGVSVIDPDKVYSWDNTSPVFIESIVSDGMPLGSPDSVLKTNSSPGNVVFTFSSPYFGDNRNLAFQYQLVGYDKEWSNPQNKRTATYLNLPPGDYTFKVRRYGSLFEKVISFSIPFPFWKTNGFYFLATGVIILLTFLALYLITKRRKRAEEEKIAINKAYAALELKALQSQMNPHFMFNCLNTIKYFIATNDKSAAGKYLGKFSKLIRMFLEHSNANWITLENEINLLSHYIEMEQLRAENNFIFNLSIDEKIDISQCEIPVMILQPFIENAIHHGLKNVPYEPVLSLSFIKENSCLKILIDDNGIGRKKAEALKQVSESGRKSMGMKLTRERIDTLNYIKGTAISLQISDKLSNNEAAGTLITIEIPVNMN